MSIRNPAKPGIFISRPSVFLLGADTALISSSRLWSVPKYSPPSAHSSYMCNLRCEVSVDIDEDVGPLAGKNVNLSVYSAWYYRSVCDHGAVE